MFVAFRSAKGALLLAERKATDPKTDRPGWIRGQPRRVDILRSEDRKARPAGAQRTLPWRRRQQRENKGTSYSLER